MGGGRAWRVIAVVVDVAAARLCCHSPAAAAPASSLLLLGDSANDPALPLDAAPDALLHLPEADPLDARAADLGRVEGLCSEDARRQRCR